MITHVVLLRLWITAVVASVRAAASARSLDGMNECNCPHRCIDYGEHYTYYEPEADAGIGWCCTNPVDCTVGVRVCNEYCKDNFPSLEEFLKEVKPMSGEGLCPSTPFLSVSQLDQVRMSRCTAIENLVIGPRSDIVNLDSLVTLNSITISIEIESNAELVSLSGLSNVHGPLIESIFIIGNPKLTTLIGLQHITSIGYSLQIAYNFALETLHGLDGIKEIGNGGLDIMYNDALIDLHGLEQVTSVGYLYIAWNLRLKTLTGLEGIHSITATGADISDGSRMSIDILHNPALQFVTGLQNVVGFLPGGLLISENPRLETLQGIQGIFHVGGGLPYAALKAQSIVEVVVPASLCATKSEVHALHDMCQRSGIMIEEGLCGPLNYTNEWGQQCNRCPTNLQEPISTTVSLPPPQTCTDFALWEDFDGYTCSDYIANEWCAEYGEDKDYEGVSANNACCVCGGGIQSECTDFALWEDMDEYNCSDYVANEWCAEYGEDKDYEGVSANNACCVCGGGNRSESARESFELVHSTCGMGIACDYQGGGRCMCDLGFGGVGCNTRTPTVRLKQSARSIVTLIEPRSSSADFQVVIPLSRTPSDVGEGLAIEVVEVGGNKTTGTAQSMLHTSLLCYPLNKPTFYADYELLPPYDNVTWTNRRSGSITANVRLFHDAEFESPESFVLRLRYHSTLYPDCVLDGNLDAVVSIQDRPPGTVQFFVDSMKVAEDNPAVAVLLERTGGSNGAVSATVSIIPSSNSLNITDFVSTKLVWEDGDASLKALAIRVIDNDDLNEDQELSLIISDTSHPEVRGIQRQQLSLVVTDDETAERVAARETVVIIGVVTAFVILVAVGAITKVRRRSKARIQEATLKTRSAEASLASQLSDNAKLKQRNIEMRQQLREAQELVDAVMIEEATLLNPFVIPFEDIDFSGSVKLGEGAFGTVFKAFLRGEIEVACKTMRVARVDKASMDKFKRELVFMAPLRHDNIVRLYGGVWSEGADKLCIVLEFCSRGSLKSFLTPVSSDSDTHGMFSEEDEASAVGTWKAVRHNLAVGLSRALLYLHCDASNPLIHRDVKPDNVLVNDKAVAKLGDFGESTTFDRKQAREEADFNGDDALTMTIVGTKLYCAPEIMLHQRYNESVDTFSFALVLLNLAVGDINYMRKTCKVLSISYASGWRPPIPASLESAAPDLVDLLKACWQTNFRDRPSFKSIVPRLESFKSLKI